MFRLFGLLMLLELPGNTWRRYRHKGRHRGKFEYGELYYQRAGTGVVTASQGEL